MLITWVRFSCLSQMQQLGNMKDNIDDLSDPEQFACLVSGHFNLLLKFKGISASNGSPKLV